MFDFPFTEPNTVSSLLLLIMYFTIIVMNKTSLIYYDEDNDDDTYLSSKEKINIAIIGLFLCCFCIDGDFFRFMEVIHDYDFTLNAYNYGEAIYGYIAQITERNYFLFRIIVWGSAFVLFCISSKRFGINIYLSTLYLFATYPVIFSYARVTLCMSICFLAFSYICCPIRNKIISFFIALLLFFISTFFHTSSYIMLAMSLMAIIPLNKKSFIILLLCLPILIVLFQDIFLYIAQQDMFFSDEQLNERLIRNADSYNVIKGFDINTPGVFLQTILQYISFYIPIFYIIKVSLFSTSQELIDNGIFKLIKIMTGFLLLSTIFFFFKSGSFVMFYRVLFMTMIPIVFVVCYMRQQNIMSESEYRKCLFSGIIYYYIRIFYCFYGYGM